MKNTASPLQRTQNIARLQSLMNVFWILIVFSAGCGQTATEPLPKRQIGTVALAVEFGGELDNIKVQIPCSEDSMVIDILRRAELNGDLKLQCSGSAETAFVKAINGVGGDTGNNRYWTYRLNGELVPTGSGVTEVDPGDEILWLYGQAPSELTP